MVSRFELDKLIAEKIMKWELWNGQWSDKETKIMKCIDASEFSPITKIQDAWLVVDSYDYDLEIVKADFEYICRMWVSKNYKGESIYEQVKASTAPMAICLAAIKREGLNLDKIFGLNNQ